MSLSLVPVTLAEANAYVERHHRHSLPVVQHKFSIGAVAGGEIVGVAIVERPKARGLEDGWTLEVTRVCTIGHRNACSFLYGACWRLIKGFGYLRAITYVKDSETAASVRAAGWVEEDGKTKGREWDTPTRRRRPAEYEVSDRVRFVVKAAAWRSDLQPRPRVEIPTTIPGQMELAA